MPRFLILIFGLFLGGCSAPPPPNLPAESDLVPDPDDPASIARWEAGPYNVFQSKIEVVELEFFHGSLGDGKPKKPKKVAVRVFGAKKTGIQPEQEAAIKNLVENEAELFAKAREAIYRYYEESYPVYRKGMELGAAMYGGADEIDDILPKIVSGNEIDRLVDLSEVYIHVPHDGKASVGIHCEIEWDPENGMGVRIDADGNVTAGSVDLAFQQMDP